MANAVLIFGLTALYALSAQLDLPIGDVGLPASGDWFALCLFVALATLYRSVSTPLEKLLAYNDRRGWAIGAHVLTLVVSVFLVTILQGLYTIVHLPFPGSAQLADDEGSVVRVAGYLLVVVLGFQLGAAILPLSAFALISLLWPGAVVRERRKLMMQADIHHKKNVKARKKQIKQGLEPTDLAIADERIIPFLATGVRVGVPGKPRVSTDIATIYVSLGTGCASVVQGVDENWVKTGLAAGVGILSVLILAWIRARQVKSESRVQVAADPETSAAAK